MTDKDRVIKLIQDKTETEICDFKKEYYHAAKKHDIVKDIVAFSNCTVLSDKFIVFNIDNETREVGNMDINSIPDVSEINNLLREYCEPHIDIEMSSFRFSVSDIAYIKISASNLDRPYMIKKDYSRDGKVLLQQGQVFLRRNTDNFKANRRDLDEIYESREKLKVVVCTDKIVENDFIVEKQTTRLHHIKFFFQNDSKQNFLINSISIKFLLPNHSFEVSGRYIADDSTKILGKSNDFTLVPYSVPANATIQKSLFFTLSNTCKDRIIDCLRPHELFYISVSMLNVQNRLVASETALCTMEYN
jgi:hypothetical protein